MAFWRRFRWVVFWCWLGVSILLAAGMLALWVWHWWLPDYVGTAVLPRIAEQFGVSNLRCEVRRIGISGVDLAAITVTDQNGRSLGVNSVRLDYVCWPFHGQKNWLEIEQIAISGLQLGLRVGEDGSIAIDGLDWNGILAKLTAASAAAEASPEAAAQADADGGAVLVESILLENIRFYLVFDDELLVVPAEMRIDLEDGVIRLAGSFELRSGTLDFAAAIRPEQNEAVVKVVGSFRLEHYSGLLPFEYRGLLEYAGTVRLPLDGGWPETAELALKLTDGGAFWDGAAADLKFTRTDDGGDFALRTALRNLWLEGELNIETGHLRWGAPDDWEVTANPTLTMSTGSRLPVAADEAATGIAGLRLRQTADGLDCRLADGALTLPALRTPDGGVTVSGGVWRFAGEATRKIGAAWRTGYELRGGDLQVRGAGVECLAPRLALTGDAERGELTMDDLTLRAPAAGMEARAVALRMPLPHGTGRLTMREILWQGTPLANFDLEFTPAADWSALTLQGGVDSLLSLAEGLRVEIAGVVRRNTDFELRLRLPTFVVPPNTDIGRYWGGTSVLADGRIAAEAELRCKDEDLTATGKLSVLRVNAALPEGEFKVENLNLNLTFSDLLTLRTPTGQRLTMERLSVGPLHLEHGDVKFKIDSPRQINLEDSEFSWCGGTLSTRYMRIVPGRNYYQTTIHCEGLNLARVMTELGVVQASGTGAVWGKMPIRVSNRGIFFNPSYLYSIPGESAELKMHSADALLAGMTPELARSTNVDLAVEALRNFHYNWARMQFSTNDDDLVLNLKFDGRPLDKLPFNYNTAGELIRVDVAGGAVFQGIMLDLNARFPLNRVMKLY